MKIERRAKIIYESTAFMKMSDTFYAVVPLENLCVPLIALSKLGPVVSATALTFRG